MEAAAHRQRYQCQSRYARGFSGTPACTRPLLRPQILGQPIVPIFSHNRTASYPKRAPYHGLRKDFPLWRFATEAPAGWACRTGGERVQQSSSIVPFMTNGQSLQSRVLSVIWAAEAMLNFGSLLMAQNTTIHFFQAGFREAGRMSVTTCTANAPLCFRVCSSIYMPKTIFSSYVSYGWPGNVVAANHFVAACA